MPNPSKDHAPRFKGRGKYLARFLRDFEFQALQAQLTDLEKCQVVGKFTDADTEDAWATCPSATTGDWDAFKKEIKAMYPEADETHKYSHRSLEKLVKWGVTTAGSARSSTATKSPIGRWPARRILRSRATTLM
jgi:hypothetical protein